MVTELKYRHFFHFATVMVVIFMMNFWLFPNQVAAKAFKDVNEGSIYYEPIHHLSDEGVVNGYPNGEFKIKASITRAEAAVMMARLLNLNMDSAPPAPFDDIKQEKWYAGAVNALYDEGMIDGVAKHQFAPENQIKRASLSRMLVNAYDLQAETDKSLPFSDVPPNTWYTEDIRTLYSHGLISGTTKTTFEPNAPMRRGDFALLSYNTSQENDEYDDAYTYVDNQSSALIDGREDSEFSFVSQALSKAASGSIYNYYTFKSDSSSSSNHNVPTVLSLEGKAGVSAATVIEGTSSQLKAMVKKHLELNGFDASIRSTTGSTTSEAAVIYPESLAKQFFENEELSSPSAQPTSIFKKYSQAIQDALHEFTTEKNVWLWNSSAVSKTPDDTLGFLSEQNIKNIYLHYNPLVQGHYPSFISKAVDKGMTVHALMGAPFWALRENRAIGKNRVDLVHNYNKNVTDKQSFKGIHFDIEPHALEQWDKDRAEVIQQWVDSAEIYTQYAKNKGYVTGSDVPFWTDGPSVAPYYSGFYNEMIRQNDYVTIMAYRNTALGPNSITSLSDEEVNSVNTPKVEVGVEFKPHSYDHVSFNNSTTSTMEKELAKVRAYYISQKTKGFKGITFHSYTEWRELIEKGR